MNKNNDFLSKDYWDNRYLHKETGWDIGSASPALVDYFEKISNKNIRILIPGCGNAFEAGYLLEHGFTNVTVVDISPIPLATLENKYNDFVGKQLHILCEDFFQLKGKFDLIIEQTFFCAIDPSLRNDYAKRIADLLTENGKLSGLLFDRYFADNPPFGGSLDEYQALFFTYFDLIHFSVCENSILPRKGTELFFECSRPKI